MCKKGKISRLGSGKNFPLPGNTVKQYSICALVMDPVLPYCGDFSWGGCRGIPQSSAFIPVAGLLAPNLPTAAIHARTSVVPQREKHLGQHVQTNTGAKRNCHFTFTRWWSLLGNFRSWMNTKKEGCWWNWGQGWWWEAWVGAVVCEVWVKATRREGTIGQRKHEKRLLC